MLKEAQKMMQDPAFQEYMKKMTESREFQTSMQKTQVRQNLLGLGGAPFLCIRHLSFNNNNSITTQKIMKDPKKVKELEEKVKQQLKEGEAALEKAQKGSCRKGRGR